MEEDFEALAADSGDYSEENVLYQEGQSVNPHIATERFEHLEKMLFDLDGPAPED